MNTIFATRAVGLSELKANPATVLQSAETEPIVVLNRNKPTGYVVGAQLWESIMEQLENLELAQIAAARLNDGKASVPVTLDDL
ncbi:type II toxin-antitoxin system prevent-host-death family antitoxin [Castellaniella sp. MT123]|uniref:type II toxin-antitoxin system prevent-host-death family antitoxin n=1 Tax=Castellaniella sp. MT123 TaxID=3140381 RepID=UPI0031F35CB1